MKYDYGISRKAYRKLRARLSEQQNHRCCYCGVSMTDGPTCNTQTTLEHIQARVDGGLTDYWNCAVACYRCNCLRGRTNPSKFFAEVAA